MMKENEVRLSSGELAVLDSLIARLGPRSSLQSGEPLVLSVDTATMSLFDPATGLRI